MGDSLLNFYRGLVQITKAWSAMDAPLLQPLLQNLPVMEGQAPLDVTAMAIVMSEEFDLSNPTKLQKFREFIQTFLLSTNQLSQLQLPGDEAWFQKDASQLLCEILLLRDLSFLKAEALIAIIASVIIFGNDGVAAIGFIMSFRLAWGHGRAADINETMWLAGAVDKGINRAKEYSKNSFAISRRVDC